VVSALAGSRASGLFREGDDRTGLPSRRRDRMGAAGACPLLTLTCGVIYRRRRQVKRFLPGRLLHSAHDLDLDHHAGRGV